MRREAIAFLLATVAGATAAGESSSRATPTLYRSAHASYCLLESGAGNAVWVQNGEVENNNANGMLEAWCPMPHDSYLNLNSSSRTVHASGYNTGCVGHYCLVGTTQDCAGVTSGSSNFCARTCRTYYPGNGGTCTAWQGDGGNSGAVNLPLSITAWSGGSWNDTYYVDVFLCEPCNSVDNKYWGAEVEH